MLVDVSGDHSSTVRMLFVVQPSVRSRDKLLYFGWRRLLVLLIAEKDALCCVRSAVENGWTAM